MDYIADTLLAVGILRILLLSIGKHCGKIFFILSESKYKNVACLVEGSTKLLNIT
jgi:hypothetical protein